MAVAIFAWHAQMFFKVFNGFRPPVPGGMPRGLAELMTACWAHEPRGRPCFRSIVQRLQRLIREARAPHACAEIKITFSRDL
jgi:hypothetical protein